MTEQEITDLGPAFATYLRRFCDCFLQNRTAAHFDTYCRGLLSDLPRKSVEPIALAAGTAVRTLQEFLVTAQWQHEHARQSLQSYLIDQLAATPTDSLGTIGIFDETSCRKWGDHTPGVQRQYLGCIGKIDNGIVTVHVGVAQVRFRVLLDAELYLPKSWDADRKRCRAAGIPDTLRYRPKWQIAWDQLTRLTERGLALDWLVFDEGYGAAVPLLRRLNQACQQFVAEIPVNFAVRQQTSGPSRRADERLTATHARGGSRHRLVHETVRASYWRAASAVVWVAEREHRLIVAINEATGEVKYFLTNAVRESLERVLAVAFRRFAVEHSFRLGKQEAGLLDYEGRDYTGLTRHLILSLVVLGFVALHTQRLRGKKPGGDSRAGVPGAQRAVRVGVSPSSGRGRVATHQRSHPVPPTSQPTGHQIPQKEAA